MVRMINLISVYDCNPIRSLGLRALLLVCLTFFTVSSLIAQEEEVVVPDTSTAPVTPAAPAVPAAPSTPSPTPAAPVPPTIPIRKPPVLPVVPKKAVESAQDDTVEIKSWTNVPFDFLIERYAEFTQRIAIRGGGAPAQPQQPGQPAARGAGGGGYSLQSYKDQRLSKEDAIIAIQNLLAAGGFSIVYQGDKFFKVVPTNTVTREGVKISVGDEKLVPTDHIVSKIFRLNYLDSAEVAAQMKLLSRTSATPGAITPFPRSNSVLVIDSAANIIEMSKLIEHLDRPPAKVETRFYPITNGKATDIVKSIQDILVFSLKGPQPNKQLTIPIPPPPAVSPEGQPIMPPMPMPTTSSSELSFSEGSIVIGSPVITADERTNQVIIITRAENFNFFDTIIKKLDANTAAPVKLKSIPLKYARATTEDGETGMAELLNEILGSAASSNKPKNPVGRPAAPGIPSPPSGAAGRSDKSGSKDHENLAIFADQRTNSLIVMGTDDDIKWVEDFIKDVDIMLAQVLLEGIVVEVTLNRSDSLGLEMLIHAADGQFSNAGLVNTLTANPVNAASISSPAAIPGTVTDGLNYFASLKNAKIDVLLQAFSKNSNVRVLQQPIIQTSHNKEASIFVGEERSFITATQTSSVASATNSVSLSSQVQQKKVGLKLTVKPRVNPEGLVVLDIEQIIDKINGEQTIDGNPIPIVASRTAKSTVSVQDRSIIVLGGLISNDETVTKSGVPLLSDIPLIGYLFSSTKKEKIRTELMVLLKPTVLWTAKDAAIEAKNRRNAIQSFKKQGLPEKFLGIPTISQQLDGLDQPSKKEDSPESLPALPVDMESLPEKPENEKQPELKFEGPQLRPSG